VLFRSDMHAKSVLEAQEAKKPRTRYDV
jgi:hypothetical protein